MLTTLARAKSLLSIPIEDTSQDDAISLVIEMATNIIETHCKRIFKKQSHSEKLSTLQEPFQFSLQPLTKLVLRQYPVHSMDTFTVLGESMTDYELFSDSGILYRQSGWPRGEYIIEASYTAGYITPDIATQEQPVNLPKSLEMACILLIQTLMRAPGVTSERVGDLAVTYQSDGENLPLAVKSLISPFVSRRV
ncbi:phage head-tail connector protein [Paenibacillus sp. SI8]|uniref:phage head-tail connector protein n=1 Tax=unclassified Paenibacillus TaxID=185978 RepID=UPI0034667E77